jgi:hypothetical protein
VHLSLAMDKSLLLTKVCQHIVWILQINLFFKNNSLHSNKQIPNVVDSKLTQMSLSAYFVYLHKW